MLHEDEIVAPAKTLLSRRKVVGTALWAAPAITVLTAAPALAAASGSKTLSITVGTNNFQNKNSMNISGTVINNSTTTNAVVTLTVTFSNALSGISAPASAGVFTLGSSTATVFTYTGTVNKGISDVFSGSFGTGGTRGTQTVKFDAVATGFTKDSSTNPSTSSSFA